MKLAIPVLLAALLLGLLLLQPPQARPPAAPPAGSGSSAEAARRPSLMAARNAQKAQQQQQQQERRAGMDDVMAQNARAMNPKLKKLMLDVLMQERTPRYQRLFDSMQLDSATQADLLKAIRDREERLFEAHRRQRAAGMKGIKEFGVDYQTERVLTEKLFGLMVGEEKAAQILQLEAEMLGTAQKTAAALTD